MECGVISILDELTMPMLVEIIAAKTGAEDKEAKSLSEIAKGGKI